MAKNDAQRAREYRDRKRGRPPRELQPCGTYAAAVRHRRKAEPICDLCRTVLAERARTYYRTTSSRDEM